MRLDGPADMAAYLGIRSLDAACGALPEAWARRLGHGLGRLAHRPIGIRRELAERQIAAAFPERSREWVHATARSAYLHFGVESCATAHYARRPADIVEQVVNPWDGPSLIAQHLPAGGGCILVLGHLGNWEVGGAYLNAAGMPPVAVARKQRGRVERRLSNVRKQLGIEAVYSSDAPRLLRRALADGRLVALVADQHASSGATPVRFLGRMASTYLGPARLALSTGAPLFYAGFVREGERYRTIIEFIEPPEPGPEAAVEMTRRWVARLEQGVRVYPDQYFWFHRRWKLADWEEENAAGQGDRERAGQDHVGSQSGEEGME